MYRTIHLLRLNLRCSANNQENELQQIHEVVYQLKPDQQEHLKIILWLYKQQSYQILNQEPLLLRFLEFF